MKRKDSIFKRILVWCFICVFVIELCLGTDVTRKILRADEVDYIAATSFTKNNTGIAGEAKEYLIAGGAGLTETGEIQIVSNKSYEQGSVSCTKQITDLNGFSAAFQLWPGTGSYSSAGNFEFLLTGSDGTKSIGINLYRASKENVPEIVLKLTDDGVSTTQQSALVHWVDDKMVETDLYWWIDYEPVGKNLNIYISKSQTKGTAPDATFQVDLSSYLQNGCYASFSAVNGVYSQELKIKNFFFQNQYQETGVDFSTYQNVSQGIDTYTQSYAINEVDYNLTVNYQYADTGAVAAPQYTGSYKQGQQYSVISPTVQGYAADIQCVKGIIGTTDVAITVTYTETITYEKLPGNPIADVVTQSLAEDIWAVCGTAYENISRPVTVTAEEWNGVSVAGVEVSAYQILSVGTSGYEVNAVYNEFFSQLLNNPAYTINDVTAYITKLSNEERLPFIKQLVEYTTENQITAVDSAVGETGSSSMTLDCSRRYQTGVGYYGGYGYYILYSVDNAGMEYAMAEFTSANPEKSVFLKGNSLTLTKEVGKPDYSLSEDIVFTISSTIPNINYATNIENYKYYITDTFSEGITIQEDSIEIKTVDENENTLILSALDYKVEIINNVMTIHLDFANGPNLKDNSQKGKTVTATYKANLNENAVIGSTGNQNKAYLTYTQNPAEDSYTEISTIESSVLVYTYEMQLTKLGSDGYVLPEVLFEVYDTYGNQMFFKKGIDGYYPVKESSQALSQITTNSKGEIHLLGVGSGDYTVIEVEAPNGYQKIPEFVISIVPEYQDNILSGLTSQVDDDTYIKSIETYKEYGKVSIIVIDPVKAGFLPATGGMGRYIIYSLGAGICIGGIWVRQKRKKQIVRSE